MIQVIIIEKNHNCSRLKARSRSRKNSPAGGPIRRRVTVSPAMGRALLGSFNDTSVMYTLKDAYSWWDELNDSPIWQDLIFHVLAALYGVVTLVALVSLQLVSILNLH